MYYISHRGNCFAPNKELENSPKYIQSALDLSFDVEIDVWYLKGQFLLGHDSPIYNVKESFLENNKFWCHAKNEKALAAMIQNKNIHCFWHEEDSRTLTSKGYIWVYPGEIITENSIAVLPEKILNWKMDKAVGICSDYIMDYKGI